MRTVKGENILYSVPKFACGQSRPQALKLRGDDVALQYFDDAKADERFNDGRDRLR